MWMRTILGYLLLVPGLLRLGYEGALIVARVVGDHQPMQEVTIFGELQKLVPGTILILLAVWVLRSRYSEEDLLTAAGIVASREKHGAGAPPIPDEIARGYPDLSLRELLSIRNAIDSREFPERYQSLNHEITRRAQGHLGV